MSLNPETPPIKKDIEDETSETEENEAGQEKEVEKEMRSFNESVLVKVTPAGERFLKEYYAKKGIENFTLEQDKEGWSKFILWELARVFGNQLDPGNPKNLPFDMRFMMDKKAE